MLENSVYVGDWLVAEDTTEREADRLGGIVADEYATETFVIAL